jgi:membrane-associated protease RseP (regulator of RpoE activity)
VVSTLFVGSLYGDNGLVIESAWDLLRPENLIKGLPFAATLLGILAAHEFGHYFAARYHKVAVTLPYFIPMPLTFGTLGAFIQLKEPVPDRRKLFDIGVAGPLAGPGRGAAAARRRADDQPAGYRSSRPPAP